jgi:poly-gamma-glutamate capsule biosynthesis protein CapA/YwtB (metallophosphatase superfamily)
MDRAIRRASSIAIVTVCLAAGLAAADAAWKWSGPATDKAVSMLIIGDIDIQLRADPTTAFVNIGETLEHADLVYANLEGLLVKPLGPTLDIPDKKGWQHPGSDGVKALKAWNIKVVGVANNVAYGRANIMKSLGVLDANGIVHTGAGANIAEAHKPAIVERKGVKIGFLQYTARWYQDNEQIATDTEPGIAKIASRDGVTIDPADVARVKDDIRRLRPQVDIIVVSHHNRDGATPTQFGKPMPRDPNAPRRNEHHSEEYQKAFAHLALDAGADLVYGHGTHTVQGVEVYKGKPILYAIGHSAFDQPGYEKSKDGLVIHTVVQDKHIQRVSFVPVTRDAHNDVLMLDPSTGEGARLLAIVKGESPNTRLEIEGQEVVLVDRAPQTSRK